MKNDFYNNVEWHTNNIQLTINILKKFSHNTDLAITDNSGAELLQQL